MPGKAECEARKYAVGFSHIFNRGVTEVPRCTAELLTMADTLLPDPSLRPLHGVVQWHAEPFMCPLQLVWGCSTVEDPFVSVAVVYAPHASDTALAEEVAHWVWMRYRPNVWPVEEWRNGTYWRDPEFKAWFELVRTQTRGICP